MKLYSILFESEAYFKGTGAGSGRLNKNDAREFFQKYSKHGVKYFGYEVTGLTDSHAQTTEDPQARGLLLPTDHISFHSKHLVFINTQEKTIIINPISKLPLQDPRVTLQLSSLLETFPEFAGYQVQLNVYNEETGAWEERNIATLQDLVSKKKTISGKYKEFNRMQDDSFEEYHFEVLQDVTEIDWYHATLRSNWNSIKRVGLIPSQEFQNPQQYGWTVLNMDLQNAVYLTYSKRYAQEIATELANRFDQPAVVLKIKGAALENPSKIVVDEDALRNDFDGGISAGMAMAGMPNYFSSIQHRLKSIGYEGTIKPGFISFAEKIESEKPDNDDENSNEDEYDDDSRRY